MFKKALLLALALFVANSAYALNSENFTRALENYSRQILRTDKIAKECKKTGNYEPYEKAMERTDQAANIVVTMISKIETKTEADVAKYLIEKFRKESVEHKKAAKLAKKMLLVKTNYLHASAGPVVCRNQQKDERSYIEVALEEIRKEQALLNNSK